MGNALKDNHKCVERSMHSNCPVCLEYLFDSRNSASVLKCGHTIHSNCLDQLMQSGQYKCPSCNTAMVDMSEQWRQLREEVARTPMPDEYKNMTVKILCNDCLKESENLFHVLGIECKECGSFNATRT